MAFQPTPMDISVIITNAALAKPGDSEPRFLTERRITPTWTVMQVKAKLETMTGIPPGCQRLRVKVPGRPDQWADGDDRLIGDWGLVKGSEIEVGSPFFLLDSTLAALLDTKWHILWFELSGQELYVTNSEYMLICILTRSMTAAHKPCGLTSPICHRSRNMCCQPRHTKPVRTRYWLGRRTRSWVGLILTLYPPKMLYAIKLRKTRTRFKREVRWNKHLECQCDFLPFFFFPLT